MFERTDQPVDRSTVIAMTRAIAHRGPDGEGIWVAEGIGLGHRRLAIRDLTDAGRQPMFDPPGQIAAIFNGEIYNDASLRRELQQQGFHFRSSCDAELIPAGYAAWGDQLFDRLEGMFAIAVWDARRHELVLARDGAGIKPLHVWVTPGRVVFGSEMKAILQVPDSPSEIDPAALHTFMAQGFVSPSRTLLRDVGQIPPGTVIVYPRTGPGRERRFWRPHRQSRIADPREATDAFLDLWHTVVNDMLASDVPVGVLLSGGLDSSLIVAQLSNDGVQVPVFTGGFEGRTHDERPMAGAVARATRMPHYAVPIEQEADPEGLFCSVVHHFDGQLADSSAYAVFRLAREVRRHVPVVLSGDGADEFFAGYPTYRATRVAEGVRRIISRHVTSLGGRCLLKLTRADERRLPALEILARFLLGVGARAPQTHPQWRRLLFSHLAEDIYGGAMRSVISEDALAEYGDAVAAPRGDLLDRCLLADQEFYLPADMLMKIDAMSMAHALEVRVPFLDRRIMDFAGTLAGSLITSRMGPDKLVLREAFGRLCPDTPIARKKRGFNTPIASLLRTGLSRLAERLLSREVDRLGRFFDPGGVRRMWRRHRDRQANHGYVLWCLLSLAVWFESLERRSHRPGGIRADHV